MYKVIWRFLTILLPFLLGCFFFASRGETLGPKTTGEERIDLSEKMIRGQGIAIERDWKSFKLANSSSQKAGNQVKLSKDDNGREITIKIGDILQIELKRSGGTGYEWYLDKSYKKYFELMKEDTETGQREGLVGTPVGRTWKLRAIERGETDIRLFLYREWEGKDKAAETFKVKVRIL
jgi:inhibitor of cysteine peptidase